MTTFDLADVRLFVNELNARRERCDHEEGVDCSNLDGTLRSYAVICCEFCEQARRWGRAIFYGRAAFDPEIETLWLGAGRELHQQASELWLYGQEMEGDCFVLENGAPLGAALWQLERLLTMWVTPQRAIAPLARQGLPSIAADQAQERIAALPKRPATWQPSDRRQNQLFRKLRHSIVPRRDR